MAMEARAIWNSVGSSRWRIPLNLLDCILTYCYTMLHFLPWLALEYHFLSIFAISSLRRPWDSRQSGSKHTFAPLVSCPWWVHKNSITGVSGCQPVHVCPRFWQFFSLTLADTVMTRSRLDVSAWVPGSPATNFGFRLRTLSTSAHFVPWQPGVEWTRLTTSWETTWFVLVIFLILICSTKTTLLYSWARDLLKTVFALVWRNPTLDSLNRLYVQ